MNYENIFWDYISSPNFKMKLESNSNDITKNKIQKIYNQYYSLIWSKLEPQFGGIYKEDSKEIEKIIKTILSKGKLKTEMFLEKNVETNTFKDTSKFNVVYEIEKKLFEEKSKFQIVQVFKTKNFGNMMVIDNDVQLTESDEANYHEMIAHVPVNYFNRDINVLIVGGGDGGTAREVLKHNNVNNLTMVDIDEVVIKASKKYFPEFSETFSNPKLNLIIGDGFKFVNEYNSSKFDLVIIDSTDFNQSVPLFSREFYERIKKIVNKDDHLICFNADNINWNEDNIKRMVKEQSKIFKFVNPYSVYIPTFAGGLYSFCLVSDNINPKNFMIDWEYFYNKKINMKYYTEKIHKSSFNLPKSLEKKMEKYQTNNVNETKGFHYLIDFENITFDKLNDIKYLDDIFITTIKLSKMNLISKKFHNFKPQGITGFYLLAESHLSFHTWPEKGQLSLDLYTCGDDKFAQEGIKFILDKFKTSKYKLNKLPR